MKCPDCELEEIRSVSKWNEELQQWDWVTACNVCGWEEKNEALTNLHLLNE